MRTKAALQNAGHATLDSAQEAFAKGREAAYDALSMGRDAAQQAVARGREAVMEQVDAASDWASSFTSNRPMRALAITAVVGVIVGLLIARR